ncbi:MAG: T9SS type A sorting domain-containing protein [Bacteroidia bacterium]
MKSVAFIFIVALGISLSAQQMPMQNAFLQNSTFQTNSNSRLGGNNSSTQSMIAIYDSTYNWKMDTSVMQWKYKSKYIDISYDNYQNESGYLFQLWNGSNWVNSILDSEIFVIYGRRLSQLQKSWNGANWVDSIQTTNNYDTSYKILATTTKKWNGSTLANSARDTFTFDSHNNLTHRFIQTWSGSVWNTTGSLNYSYTYNSSGLISSVTFDYSSYSSSVNKTYYTYNSNNNVSKSSYYPTIGFCGLMKTRDSYYYYNPNNKLKQVYDIIYNINQPSCNYGVTNYSNEYWLFDSNGNVLTDSLYTNDYPTSSYLYKYAYDLNNNLLKKVYSKWNGTSYVRNYQDEYTYDVNNLKQTYTHKVYAANGVKLNSGDSTVYYFSAAVDVKELDRKQGKLIVYPNPTSSTINIEMKSDKKQNKIQIIDVFGKELFNTTTKNKTETIDVSSLPSGLYFIKTDFGAQKFIKQ